MKSKFSFINKFFQIDEDDEETIENNINESTSINDSKITNNDENDEDYIPDFLRVEIDMKKNPDKYTSRPATLADFGIVFEDGFGEDIDDDVKEKDKVSFDDEDDYDDLFIDPIEKLDKSTDVYPISQYVAFQIADRNQNLKSDFCRNSNSGITYLSFDDCKIELKKIDTETYWLIKITDGEMSWVELDYSINPDMPDTIFCDGTFDKEDYKKLQCLINVQTGEYKYFPEEK